jgi:hypothetical protein
MMHSVSPGGDSEHILPDRLKEIHGISCNRHLCEPRPGQIVHYLYDQMNPFPRIAFHDSESTGYFPNLRKIARDVDQYGMIDR